MFGFKKKKPVNTLVIDPTKAKPGTPIAFDGSSSAVQLGPIKRARLVIYKDKKKQWRWRFVAVNGRILADSAESYVRRSNIIDAADRFLEATRTAYIDEI